MKTLSAVLLSSVVLALAGCGNQGSSSDPYNTDSGTISNANYNRKSVTNDSRGSAVSPGRRDDGVISSTNYPDMGTNDPGLRVDPARTNIAPRN